MSVHLIFLTADGGRHEVEAEPGLKIKDVALANNIAGIIGECGGFASCGTCHAYVEGEAAARLPVPQEDEANLLEGVVDMQQNSRLTCQIVVKRALDGLVLRVPETQF